LSFGVIRSVLGQFIYPEMLIYLENEPATGKENALFVVQMKNRFSRVLLGAIPTSVPDLEVQRLPGADLYAGKAPDGKEGKSVALSGRSLMFSSNQAFARQAIEREEKEHQGEPSEKMQQMLDNLVQDKPESGEDLTLVLTNDGSRLETWITEAEKTLGSSGLGELLVQGMAEKKMAASDILAVRLGMDLTSVDRAKVSISFFCRQAEIARKFSDVAKSLAARVLQAGENRVLTVTKSDVRVRGSSVLVELEISGLKKIIDQVLPAAVPAKSAEKTPAVAPGV
ncbi:MAG: hypothetical protein K1X53_04865, partial [Candidatus Sumerlaeaceae bacterium]|nr:hypothetical protein [Candidatus Sumerlaeaceae bacterium]